ncbi:MAG TPA: DNA mismatch repair protein MutS [Rhodoblastus sp.]|nr:DNA mismatch repair protein MutS [Rhodoblastus sp.]
MKACLLYRDRDFDLDRTLTSREIALAQDLGLDPIIAAMAGDDEFLSDVARKVLLTSVGDVEGVEYRQAILADCLRRPQTIRDLYRLTVEAATNERRARGLWFGRYPTTILHSSVNLLQAAMGDLRALRALVDEYGATFRSEGLTRFCAMIRSELDDSYFHRLERHLRTLRFRNGLLVSASLGLGLKGDQYTVCEEPPDKRGWLERLFGPKPLSFTYTLHPRDEAGARALSQLNDQGLNLVANALAQSADHIVSFFQMLQRELAFYVACLNLHDRLKTLGAPVCFPGVSAHGSGDLSATDLRDAGLALVILDAVVGNDLAADGKILVVITGANRGGKSTFLRSLGQALVMTQAGMFVVAGSFRSQLHDRIFTHYKREEDKNLDSGKLDEELKRMSELVDEMTGRSVILFNESFAATNEREGSEIACQIADALGEKGVRSIFVTHLYQFAHRMYAKAGRAALFLRADRSDDGTRSFRIVPGEPLETSYGQDLFDRIFPDAGALSQPPDGSPDDARMTLAEARLPPSATGAALDMRN